MSVIPRPSHGWIVIAGNLIFHFRAKLEKEYADVQRTVFQRNPVMFPADKYTKELFDWAFVMLFSRAARLASKSSGEEVN